MFDKSIASRHISEHYRPNDYLAAVLITRGAGGKATEVKHEFATAEALAGERRMAHFRAANASGADIYLTVNTLKAGTRNREKRDVETIRHLYIDVDENGPEVLKGVLSSHLPKPSKVLLTSPGKYQLLWKVEGFTPDQAESIVRGMTRQYGADQAVWDCARILRIPGFRNHIIGDKLHVVSAVPGDRSAGGLTPADFPAFPELERQIAGGEGKKLGAGHHSQSEVDWGRVLRRLERNEDPAAIKAWLERERQDKARPAAYAEGTVNRAMAYRQRQGGAARCQTL